MKTVKKTFKVLKVLILAIVSFLSIYILLAYLLSRVTVNSDCSNQSQDVVVYLKTNGVHTDIITPLKNDIVDWSSKIKIENTQGKDTVACFIAFGWGDKGFYLNTPQWSDLKASTAFNAAFWRSSTAIHTTFHRSVHEDTDCIKVLISKENYKKLVTYIDDSFQLDESKNPILIAAKTYGKNDSFYEAKGKYSMFHTCNSWVNDALKESNQKAAFWTVTDSGIFCHYK